MLIIGSLYWDSAPPRPRWRAERLDCMHREHVRVPIRYGRRSTKRGDTYTMVISPQLGAYEYGTAIAVPYWTRNLIEEAEKLWAAEDNRGRRPEGRISTDLGCVALLENPDHRLPDRMREEWKERIVREEGYHGSVRMNGEERDVVDPRSGLLAIDWPRTVTGSRLEWSALLATVTRPRGPEGSPRRYPLPEEIADAWGNAEDSEPDSGRTADYFWKNREHGITTHQDPEIEALLRKLGVTTQ
ncbi:MAG: hypothetical protein OXI46_07715 [Gemmatimonadota bacterium]|nr:hypothetical protein [Gemmatimonadota bacterium]